MSGRIFTVLLSALLWIATATAFGLVESGNLYTVTTDGGLVFSVDKTTGDITSLKYNGVETQGTSKHSQISSGIGASCSNQRGGNSNNYILITCTAGDSTTS